MVLRPPPGVRPPRSRRGPPCVPGSFLGLQSPRLNPGSDGLRGLLDSRPVSSPQVGPGAVRPARACTGSTRSSAGRRPRPLSWDSCLEKGSPCTGTGSPGETPPQPRAQVPTRSPGAAILARARLGPPTHPFPVPGPAYRSGEAAAAARSPGPRRLPAAGSEVASSPRPRRQRWSLVPAASALDAGARLRCKEENATEGFKVKKERARGGASPPPSRPSPPLPSPLLLASPRPRLGLRRPRGGRRARLGPRLGRGAGGVSRARRSFHRLCRRPPPLPAPSPHPEAIGALRAAPRLWSLRRRLWETLGSLRWVRGLGCNTRRAAAVLGQRGGGVRGLTNNNFFGLLGGSGLFQ